MRQASLAIEPRAWSEAGVSQETSVVRLAQSHARLNLMPYVYKGPKNQRHFIDQLVKLQMQGLSKLGRVEKKVLLERLSFVRYFESTDCKGLATAGRLESARRVERHWNVNYFSHGWHRYVGRFPPQVVRAVLNYFGATKETLVLDPFVGSGTTSAECMLLGIPSVGVEVCPLSALIARVKSYNAYDLRELQGAYIEFENQYEQLWRKKTRSRSSLDMEAVLALSSGTIPTFPNIEKWLTPRALLGLSISVEIIERLNPIHVREFFLCALSASMRSIGNVDVDVVRAEYSRSPRTDVDVRKVVLRKVRSYLTSVSLAIGAGTYPGRCKGQVIKSDVRAVTLPAASFDFVITSPPYGIESVSYLRTHLLSYRVLKRFLKEDPYDFGKEVIGSEYFDERESPADVCHEIPSGVAREFFARFSKSKGALKKRALHMAHFFVDMHKVGERLYEWLKPNGRVCLVVGDKKIEHNVIPTRDIIQEIYEEVGFQYETSLKHKLKCNNTNAKTPWEDRAIEDEHIMFLRKS